MNEIIVELYGASGGIGGSHLNGGKYASMGGYVKTKLKVTQGGEYYVYVGGKPVGGKHIGGFNGGGNSGNTNSGNNNAAGGGASHISSFNAQLRYLEDNKDSILAVAGGGGGWGKQTTENVDTILQTPGNGGGPNGLGPTPYVESRNGDGFFDKSASGGTQTNGGSGGIGCTLGSGSGSFGKGGDGIKHDQRNVPLHYAGGCKKAAGPRAMSVEHSAGGGAGYYGGGAGGLSMSGAGGSSYVNPLYKSDDLDFETTYDSRNYPTNNAEGQHGFIKITDENGTVTKFSYNGTVQIYTAPNIVPDVLVPEPADIGNVMNRGLPTSSSPINSNPISLDGITASDLPISGIAEGNTESDLPIYSSPIPDITDDNTAPITEPGTPISITQEEEEPIVSHVPIAQEKEPIASYVPIAQLAEESIASYAPITQLAEESIASYAPIAQLAEESNVSYAPIVQLAEESIASFVPVKQLAGHQVASYKQLAEESLALYKPVNNITEKQNTYNVTDNNIVSLPSNDPVSKVTKKQNTTDDKIKSKKITDVPDIVTESSKIDVPNLKEDVTSNEKTKSIDEVGNNETSEKKIASKKGTNWLFYFFVLLILILILFAYSLFATKKS